jgi:hypothetical protein
VIQSDPEMVQFAAVKAFLGGGLPRNASMAVETWSSDTPWNVCKLQLSKWVGEVNE